MASSGHAGAAAVARAASYDTSSGIVAGSQRGLQAADENICEGGGANAIVTAETGTLSDDQVSGGHGCGLERGGGEGIFRLSESC